MINTKKPMLVIQQIVGDVTYNVLTCLIDEEWIELASEVVPEWAIAQHVALGSTEWRSSFAAWINAKK